VEAALESGYSPSQLWEMDEEDKAFIVAYHRVKSTISGWEAHLSEQRMKRNRNKHKHGT
jgi:hypothetical protein